MTLIDPKPPKSELAEGPGLVALWAAFTIWVAIHVVLLTFCVSIPVLWLVMATFGRRWSIASKLSTRSMSDRLAWIAFSFGIFAMLGVVWISLVSEGDGAGFRTWSEVRRHVRLFLVAGIIGAGVPALVTLEHYLGRLRQVRSAPPDRSKESPFREEPALE